MKNFQTVVQELLHNHERQRRYIALLTALCMLMAFTVSIILIEPAESMTGELACGMSEHIHNENCFTYTCGLEDDENHVHSAECRTLTCGKTEHAHSENCYIHEDEQPAEIMQINEPEIFDDKPLTIAGDVSESESSVGNEISPQAMENYFDKFDKSEAYDFSNQITGVSGSPSDTLISDNERSVTFSLSYRVEANGVSESQPYIYYALDMTNLTIVNFPLEGEVYDADYTNAGGSHLSGHYYIGEDGVIKICFTDEYLNAKKAEIAENGLQGSISFKANVRREDGNDGDQDVYFGEQKVTIKFPSKELDVVKNGELEKKQTTDGVTKNTGIIKWTITVNDPTDSSSDTNLNGYILKDQYFTGSGVTITAVSKDGNSIEDIEDIVKWNETSKQYEFTDENSNTRSVTFTYYTNIEDEQLLSKTPITNEAVLSKNENEKKDSASVDITDKATIEKSGTPDYRIDGSVANGMIHWKITLKTNYENQNLSGYTIYDEAFNESLKNFKITPESAASIPTNGQLTLNDGVGEQVTIEYDAPADSLYGWENNKNSCSFTYPGGTNGGNKEAKVTYSPYTFTKTADIDYDSNPRRMKWTIVITNTNNAAQKMENVVLEDDMFPDDANDFTLSEGAKLEIVDDKYVISSTSFPVTLTYYTNLTEKEQNSKVSKTNHFQAFLNGNPLGDKQSVTKDYTPRNTLDKFLIGDASGSGIITQNITESVIGDVTNSSVSVLQELHWKISLAQDDGFAKAGKVLVDTMDKTNGGQHYISEVDVKEKSGDIIQNEIKAQLKRMTIKARKNAADAGIDLIDWNSVTPTTEGDTIEYKSDYCTVVFTKEEGKITKFEITFNDKLDSEEYKLVDVEYYTTADLSKVGPDRTASFNNTAKFGTDLSQEKEYEFKNVNPDNAIYEKFIVDKDGNLHDENENFTRSLDDVPIVKFDGEEYYVFSWIITTENNMDITDYLPEGFSLVEVDEIKNDHSKHISPGGNSSKELFLLNEYFKAPLTAYPTWEGKYWPEAVLESGMYLHNSTCEISGIENSYFVNGNQVTFNRSNSNAHAIFYSAKIKVSDLTKKVTVQGYSITNSVKGEYDDIEYAEKTVTETLTPGHDRVLSKDYEIGKEITNEVKFTIDFNPEGKTLSNSDRVTLNDVLTVKDNPIYEGENMSDALKKITLSLKNFTIYEVNDDGSRTKLENDYLYTFTPKPLGDDGNYKVQELANGKKDIIAAELNFSVPDSKHLQIEYTYHLQHEDAYDNNKKEEFNGKDPVAILSNTVSMQTRTHTDSSTNSNIELHLQSAEADVSTIPLPKIEKVNIGDYLTNNLGATFYIAKYDEDGWKFAKKINSTGTSHTPDDWETLTDVTNSLDDVTISNLGTIGETGKIIKLADTVDYNIKLESGKLYALLEIVSPSGYQQIESKPLIYYFIYNNQGTPSVPEGLTNIHNVQAGGVIHVPNSKLIDIKATKTWDNSKAFPTGAKVKLKLYWSYERLQDGNFPDKDILHEVKLTDGLVTDDNGKIMTSGNFNNEITLDSSHTTAEWRNLLNGKEGKVVYYYVKETSYEIDGEEYTLQSDGTYKNGEKVGKYFPLYSNNALLETDTVEIDNYSKLNIQKLWLNSDNEVISAPTGVGKIQFRIWGVKKDEAGKNVYYQIRSKNSPTSDTISLSGTWKTTLTDDNVIIKKADGSDAEESVKLSSFDDFLAEEILTESQMTLLHDFNFSYNVNITNGTGQIDLINKDRTPTSLDFSVTKEWKLKTGDSTPESIKVNLYQTIERQEDNGVGLAESGTRPYDTYTLNAANSWKYTWKNLPYKDSNGNQYLYYAVEIDTGGNYVPIYVRNSEYATSQSVIIRNYSAGDITVEKIWQDNEGHEIENTSALPEINFEVYQSNNNSEVEIKEDGLPEDFYIDDSGTVDTTKYTLCTINGRTRFNMHYSDGEWKTNICLPAVDENGNEYHYYVRELTVNGYTTSYEGNGATANGENTIKITNKAEPVTGLELQKIWSESGSTTASEDAELAKSEVKISANLKRKVLPNTNKPDGKCTDSGNSEKEITITKDQGLSANTPINLADFGIKDLIVKEMTFKYNSIQYSGVDVSFNGDYGGRRKYGDVLAWEDINIQLTSITIWGEVPESITFVCQGETPSFQVTSNPIANDNTIDLFVGEYAAFEINRKDNVTLSINSGTDCIKVDESDHYRIVATAPGDATVKISHVDGEVTYQIHVENPIDEVYQVIEFLRGTSEPDGIWLPDTAMQEELKHLPMTDESGRKYLYYIEEIFEGDNTALQGYEKPKYFNDTRKLEEGEGVELTEGSLVSLKVVNTRIESSTTTMPSTGGKGARKYYTVGGMLLLMSACGWAMRRRKRVIPH